MGYRTYNILKLLDIMNEPHYSLYWQNPKKKNLLKNERNQKKKKKKPK